MKHDNTQQGISVYLHIPFCRRKCRYCDFLSWPGKFDRLDDYVEALIKEVDLYRGWLAARPVSTVFFGGGTPSVLSSDQVFRILTAIGKVGTFEDAVEITIEANPHQLMEETLHGYREAGVNRLSIGLQSTHQELLDFLGRDHTVQDFCKMVEAARKSGIENLNGDLIFGIPGQTMLQWESSLKTLVEMALPHVSCYGLTYEEGTPIHQSLVRNEVKPLSEDEEWRMFRHGIQWLQEQGYDHYEISNFALPSYECRHNLTYWENREYIGLGAGAHGFMEATRLENTSSLTEYLQLLRNSHSPVIGRHLVTEHESVSETCFLGLRLRKGISEQAFLNRYGKSLTDYFPEEIPKLLQQGLLLRENGYYRLTEKGIDLSNHVFQVLMLS